MYQVAKKMKDDRKTASASARNNWRKVFAIKKFLFLAKFQSKQPPADLLVGQKFVVGKKFANGAFGQVINAFVEIIGLAKR